jgi:hypothetical protein
MELAFTLAKNATKPNPFEIISLQTTRRKNNWKTEKMSTRAVVTLRDGTDQRVQFLMLMMMTRPQNTQNVYEPTKKDHSTSVLTVT